MAKVVKLRGRTVLESYYFHSGNTLIQAAIKEFVSNLTFNEEKGVFDTREWFKLVYINPIKCAISVFCFNVRKAMHLYKDLRNALGEEMFDKYAVDCDKETLDRYLEVLREKGEKWIKHHYGNWCHKCKGESLVCSTKYTFVGENRPIPAWGDIVFV